MNELCSKVTFFQGLDGRCSSLIPFNSQSNMIEYERPHSSFAYRPITSELAIIILNEPVKCNSYLKLGPFMEGHEEKPELTIISYPSSSYAATVDL